MIRLRKSADRGHARQDWLESYHTFSFADYQDPAHMGFRQLRVLNEDRVQGGRGFGMHPHRDMEIISLVFSGTLEHRDDLGHREQIGPGELQRISAGTGILHSEVNPDPDREVHFVQIWIHPQRPGLSPGYEKRSFAPAAPGTLQWLATPDGRDGSATIRQDTALANLRLETGQSFDLTLAPGRHAWLQLISGALRLADQTLATGDGAAISDEPRLALQADSASQLLLFDLN